MTVLHTNGIHTLRVSYCGCSVAGQEDNLQQLMRNAWYPASITDPHTCATYRVLETYRRLNVVANTNVRDFVTTLEEMSCPVGTTWVAVSNVFVYIRRILLTHRCQDRYKAFGRMTRQWAFLKRLKRAGRGHAGVGGVANTPSGALAVRCWACPYDGVNLPANWRDVDPEYRLVDYSIHIFYWLAC